MTYFHHGLYSGTDTYSDIISLLALLFAIITSIMIGVYFNSAAISGIIFIGQLLCTAVTAHYLFPQQ